METTNPYQAPLQGSAHDSEPATDPSLVSRHWMLAGAFVAAIPGAIYGVWLNSVFPDPHRATPASATEAILACAALAAGMGIPAAGFGAILGAVFYRLRSLLREIMS